MSARVHQPNREVPRPRWAWPLSALLVIFGIASIASGGSVLFGGPAQRLAAGDVVPFVVWFNFLSGFAYVAAGIGIGLWRTWGARLALILAVAILVVAASLAAHVASGGAFEPRTAYAMAFRSAVWLATAIVTCRALACLGRA